MINALGTAPVTTLDELAPGYDVYDTALQAVGVQGDERSYRNIAILRPASGGRGAGVRARSPG